MTLYRRAPLRTRVTTAVVALLLLSSAGPAAADGYVDARLHPNQIAGWDRFRRVEDALVRGFNQVCGDTFCEGEYGNLQPQRFRCSVHAATGVVHECVWTFAGSTARVDARTGEVVVDAPSWACTVPLTYRTRLSDLLAALEAGDPLDAALPDTSTSLYDALTDCL